MADPAQFAREAAPAHRQRGGVVETAGVLRPVMYEGGPAPPAAHALRPALPTSRARPFATVAYVPGGAAVLEPAVMPQSCVHASPGDPACVLVVHHVRERKAGPQIPVTVAQCRTHRRGFTRLRRSFSSCAARSLDSRPRAQILAPVNQTRGGCPTSS